VPLEQEMWMPLVTIVERYIMAAMEQAEAEELEEGGVVATVPGLIGIVASGADVHNCALDLYTRLEDWVRVVIEQGFELPVFGGIDLNAEASALRATNHRGADASTGGEYFTDEDEFLTALNNNGY
jgi:hypothetical protein